MSIYFYIHKNRLTLVISMNIIYLDVYQNIFEGDDSMLDKDLVGNIVSGFELKVGSVVLIQFWGENKDLEILDNFALEIAKIGCFPVKWQYSQEYLKRYFEETADDYLKFPDKLFRMFDICDAVIDVCMFTPPKPHAEFPKNKIPFYRDYMISLMGSLKDKETFIQVKVPTRSNAETSGVEDYELYKSKVLKAMSVDYKQLKLKTNKLHQDLANAKKVEIETAGYKLEISIEGRQWHKDDGNGDVPAGEIYIAPIENSANGQILIPYTNIMGKKYENLLLTFESGRLVDSSSKNLLEVLNNIHPESNILAEFGIGLNDQVTEVIGYAPLDEKCIGTAHIALGMNSMFGGTNSCPVHFDLVFKPDKIIIDGKAL